MSEHARLVPQAPGLGQQTGGDEAAHRAEARKLVALLAPLIGRSYPRNEDRLLLSFSETRVIQDVRRALQVYGEQAQVSGKTVFWLRDIKDKAMERGWL